MKTQLFIARSFLLISFLASLSAWARDDGYARFAQSIASPLFESVAEARAGYTDGKVMLRNEIAFQAILGWESSSPSIEKVRREVHSALSSCNSSLSKIRSFDASTPDFGILAKRGVTALPALDDTRRDAAGNLRPEDKRNVDALVVEAAFQVGGWVWDKYQASEELDRYRKYSRQARRASHALRGVAAERNNAPRPMVYGIGITFETNRPDGLLITEIRDNSPAKASGLAVGDKIVAVASTQITEQNAKKSSGAITGPRDSKARITFERAGERKDIAIPRSIAVYEALLLNVDINGSWNGFYSSDEVFFKNTSGRDLTHVTLYVDVRGRHGKEGSPAGDKHLHYVDHWPAGATQIARYMSSSASGIARNESVDQIDTLRYELYSAEFSQENVFTYAGDAYDTDVKQFCENISLRGSWRTYAPDDLFHNSGFLLQNGDKGYSFPSSGVRVRAYWWDTTVGYHWKMTNNVFPSGTSDSILFEQRYFDHSDFNRGQPDRVEVVLEFPYTNYTCEKLWDFRK